MLCVSFSVHSTGMSPNDASLIPIQDFITKDYNSIFYGKVLKKSQYVYNYVYHVTFLTDFPTMLSKDLSSTNSSLYFKVPNIQS